jgi:hypothetical protein
MGRTLYTSHLLCYSVLSAALACSTNTANPDVALSTSREGLPAALLVTGRSTSVVGDTLVCESHRRFRTTDGDRWLWVRVLRERQADREEPDRTHAEALVSTDAAGRTFDQKVELAGVSLDGEADYTLRNTAGVRTAEPRKSPKQAHRARGYTVGPNMGPIDVSCGGG